MSLETEVLRELSRRAEAVTVGDRSNRT
ncbi:hypothetical protein ACQP1G_35010 [Nocardia sp. CA-107356]